MTLRPLGDRITVKEDARETLSPGGIHLPEQATEKPMMGTVVSVGSGRLMESGEVVPMELKPGDRVLFGKYSGTEVKIDGERLLIMREAEVLGVLG